MIEPGDIFETKHGRWVTRYVAPDNHPRGGAVFVDALHKRRGSEGTASGIGYCGAGAEQRCLEELGRPVARMRINGAWKLYRRACRERDQLRGELERERTRPWWRRLLGRR